MHFANQNPPANQAGQARTTPDSSSQSAQNEAEDSFDFFLYLRILLMNWWIILPLTLAGAGAGYFIWMRTPPIYRAACQLEIINNIMLGNESDLIGATYNYTFLSRQILLLESPKLNKDIEDRLKPKWEPRRPPNARKLELTVRPVKEVAQTMVNIHVDSYSPDYSLEYLQELLAGYERLRYDEASDISRSTLENLQKEFENYSEELEEVEEEIITFESQHDLMFEQKRNESHQQLLAKLLSQQSRITAQRQMLERQFPFLEDSNAATLQEVLSLALQNAAMIDSAGEQLGQGENAGSSITISNSSLDSAGQGSLIEWRENEAKIIRLNAEYDNLLKVYKPAHPKMKTLKEQIDSAKRDLEIAAILTMKRLHSRRDALKMQEEAVAMAAQELKRSYIPNSASRAQYDRLNERATRLARRQDQIFTTIVDLTSSAVDRTVVRILQAPVIDEDPIWPVRWKIMLVATMVALGGSMALVLFTFFIKSRLYNFSALEDNLGIQCLAGVQKLSLGRVKRSRKIPIVVTRERDSLVSETFRNIRTSVEHALPENCRTMMITSPDPSEGKSLLGLNTAVVFSWNRNKVLLVDGDFRKRSISRAFPEAPKRGLTDLLTDTDLKLEDCIVKAPIADIAPNLDYLPAGHKRDDTAELLTMPRLRQMLDEMSKQYDFIMIDSAPVNRVVDTLLLAKEMDAILLVARSGKTTVPAMRYCYSRIGIHNVIGYVLNGIDRSNSRYSYYSSGYYQGRYYYNGYYYKGYYGDSSEG